MLKLSPSWTACFMISSMNFLRSFPSRCFSPSGWSSVKTVASCALLGRYLLRYLGGGLIRFFLPFLSCGRCHRAHSGPARQWPFKKFMHGVRCPVAWPREPLGICTLDATPVAWPREPLGICTLDATPNAALVGMADVALDAFSTRA